MIQALIAASISFILGLVLYPRFIKFLQDNNMQQTPSEYALEEYKNKPQTVTFGGFLFVSISVVVAIILNGLNLKKEFYLVVFAFVFYALIGLVDDYKIVKEGKNDGLTAKQKLLLQFLLALVFYILYILTGGTNTIAIPLLNIHLNLGIFYFIFILLYFAGFSNAVNLTDGMDGLAGGTSVIALLPLAYIAYTQNHIGLLILLLSVIGALLSFLVFNRKPARIFMGDVGSLALGALFASVAVLLDIEVMTLVIGGVFVYETACVVIQQISWRTRHKRVFRYTPIHYSFTLSGWSEKKVVYFFYGLGILFVILGLGLKVIS